ncbi:hypothetical protein AX14_011300 [Amanita brunnescens Koide BX004]|nr:hypothetical protein AX14_011300 [Amanita brunnescens Koide BX004]
MTPPSTAFSIGTSSEAFKSTAPLMQVCAVDVAQFFPSLSHAVTERILERLGFSPILVQLIKSYFEGRVTSYKWDSARSRKYNFSLGTPQGDCLSPILSALYLSVAIKKIFPETMPPATTRCLFYVDDGALITASPSLQTNVDVLRLYLLLLLQALSDIGLQVEASKTELIHFFAFELTAARRLSIAHQPHLTFTWLRYVRVKCLEIQFVESALNNALTLIRHASSRYSPTDCRCGTPCGEQESFDSSKKWNASIRMPYDGSPVPFTHLPSARES